MWRIKLTASTIPTTPSPLGRYQSRPVRADAQSITESCPLKSGTYNDAAESDGGTFAFSSPMTKHGTHELDQPTLQRNPDDWKTGDEPMTDAQRSYLETLCRETGEAFDDSLSKAEASKRIDQLRERSPRLAQE